MCVWGVGGLGAATEMVGNEDDLGNMVVGIEVVSV